MKNIGVTGAFGFLGSNFLAALLERPRGGAKDGVEVTAFASRARSNPLFKPCDARVESLDILDQESMVRKFSGMEAIAHFAGRVDYRPCERRTVWDTDVLGTVRVFEAALAAGVGRVLYVSSISALGASPPGLLADETSSPYGDPLWPGSFSSASEALAAVGASSRGDYAFFDRMRVAYFDAKLAGWELAKYYARERGLQVVTIFPGTAVGSGDLHYAISKLVDNVWEGRLRLSFGGSTSFMPARDFARGALLALERGRPGEGYILAGRDEDNLSYVEFQDRIAILARAEGWRAQLNPPVLPRELLLAAAGLAEKALPRGALTRAFVLSGSVRNVCSSAKARSELGYQPSGGLDEAILECRRFSEAASAACRPATRAAASSLTRLP